MCNENGMGNCLKGIAYSEEMKDDPAQNPIDIISYVSSKMGIARGFLKDDPAQNLIDIISYVSS